MWRTGRRIAVVGIAVGCILAIVISLAKHRPRPSAPNVILISLDTLRADRLGVYGYERDTSPFLKALASRGAVFEMASSVSSWTLPAHVSLFSGLYPSTHGVTRPTVKISSSTRLLAERLKEIGYATLGFPGGGYVSAEFGFNRGFESYPKTKPKVLLGQQGGLRLAIERAKPLLSGLKGKPFFLFLHTMDIHCPRVSPEPYFSMFQTADEKRVSVKRCWDWERSSRLTPEKLRYISNRYDGGVRWADSNLRDFFEWLEISGFLRGSYVIILSDHGEELGENGHVGHRRSLRREVVQIPFIVLGPDVKPGRYPTLASIVDVVPTVLDLLGLPIPDDIQGHSLASVLRGGEPDRDIPRWRYAEVSREKNLRSRFGRNQHLIVDLDTNKAQLYPQQGYPENYSDIAPAQPLQVAEHRREISQFAARISSRLPSQTEDIEIEEETVGELKTLGYL